MSDCCPIELVIEQGELVITEVVTTPVATILEIDPSTGVQTVIQVPTIEIQETPTVIEIQETNFIPVFPAGALLPHIGVSLLGTKDGANTVFTTPLNFLQEAVGRRIAVYFNGQRLEEGVGCDYEASESGGVGTGYDTITLAFAPLADEELFADYYPA